MPPEQLDCSTQGQIRCTLSVVKAEKRAGNWTPDGKPEQAALRRDYLSLTSAQRAEQVFELSRFMSQVAQAGRRQRGG